MTQINSANAYSFYLSKHRTWQKSNRSPARWAIYENSEPVLDVYHSSEYTYAKNSYKLQFPSPVCISFVKYLKSFVTQ